MYVKNCLKMLRRWIADGTATTEQALRVIDELLELQDVPDKNVGKWISVKDRLPTESDGTVLICYPNEAPYNLMEPHVNARHNRRVATGHYSQHARTWYHGDFNAVGGADPIAWMPLPEPPKEET